MDWKIPLNHKCPQYRKHSTNPPIHLTLYFPITCEQDPEILEATLSQPKRSVHHCLSDTHSLRLGGADSRFCKTNSKNKGGDDRNYKLSIAMFLKCSEIQNCAPDILLQFSLKNKMLPYHRNDKPRLWKCSNCLVSRTSNITEAALVTSQPFQPFQMVSMWKSNIGCHCVLEQVSSASC